MRLLLTGCLVLALIAAVTPVQAQEPLVLYDDFSGTRPVVPVLGKSIDPDKWVPRDSNTTYILDYAREIQSNKLHLLNRSYGSATAGASTSTVVRIQVPSTLAPLVTAMQARVTVTSFEVTGGVDGLLSRLRGGRLSGFFFNPVADGNPNSNAGDILAAIYIQGLSDNPDVLRVVAHVETCDGTPSCNDSTLNQEYDFGTIKVGQTTRLLIQWDKTKHQFIFQRDKAQEVYTYSWPEYTSGNPAKRIDVSHRVVTNTMGEIPVAAMDVLVDDVFVNASALSAP